VIYWWRSERPASVQAIAEVTSGPQNAYTRFFRADDRARFGFIVWDDLTAGSQYEARFLFIDRYDEYVILRETFSTGEFEIAQPTLLSNTIDQVDWSDQTLPDGWYWRLMRGPYTNRDTDNPSPWQGQVIYEGTNSRATLPPDTSVNDLRLFATDGQAYTQSTTFDRVLTPVANEVTSNNTLVDDRYLNQLLLLLVALYLILIIHSRRECSCS
jgi:hypothetical protein